ncbi:hypothetical protein I3760_08G166600 [Carya illinoinensis]|nr:hypothetical protein I3760_08G166600 [Carya illinoinensis]
MAENIAISIVAKIAEYTVKPIGRWLCYSCHYNSNIENLKKQEEKLRVALERVQHSVDAAASRNGEKIYSDVSKWLEDVGRITELATKRLRESEEEAGTGSSNAACVNLKQRHQLSREAQKIVENIAQLFAELHNNGNFEKVSNPALPSEEMDYNSNMENLKNQKEKLQHACERVQHSVDAAFNNGEKIYSDVSKWLIDVGRITELATKRLRESEEEAGTGSSNAACQNLEHRHQLSREAKKMVGDIAELFAELHKNGNFEKVSYRIPPSKGMVMTTTDMDYMAMESRMTAVKGIMEALGNADIDKIGVWGMPGVGKSTLMKEIARQATEEKLFNDVVMIVMRNSPDVWGIQRAIAYKLGLNFDQDADEEDRASHLQQRLSKDKKILVILDDIWKAVDLHKIGIPSKGCKVVMTSRDRDVLISGMGTQKAIHELKILQKEESWNLFEKMAGDSFKDRPEVRGIATKIVEKCGGLPIALVTVSKALRNKRLGGWQDALVRLTRPTPEHDTKLWSPIYSCIQLSYEHLDGEEAVKSLFLLCAGQGYYISYQDLLRYGFGLGLFLNIYTLEEARNRLESLVSNLLDSCLLLQSPHSSKEFYMHDLVRDVATIIASSKDHNMFVMRDDGGQKAWPDVEALNRYEALSIHGGDIDKHPNKMECRKLRFFHVDCKDSRNLKISDIFFQGMDKLEVLSLRRMRLSSLFPFTNLQTLCLDGCMLGDIHWIGELKTLVILSLAYSDISNLPREVGSLACLRLLDLSNCFGLRVIPPNVLSSLVNLEELYMQKTKVQWEVEGPSNEGKNASLAELKKLSQLTTLEIDIPNANNLPANLFHEKLKRYKICIGDEIYSLVFTREAAFSRVLKLNLNMSFRLDLGIKMLLKRTEYLSLDEANSTKSVLYEVDREDFQQLKLFHIKNNGNIKHILESGTSVVAFPILETFVLKNMFSLEEICQDKLPLSSFKNLKVLKVENCEKLKFIFSSSIARGLSLLEELNITGCKNMVAIFVKEEEDGIEDQGDTMLFGRLQTLVLKDLRMLVGFLSTKDSFMADCRETNSEGNHDLPLPLLHHDQVSFPSLQTLRMKDLPKIKHIWSCGQEPKTVLTGLEQLKILEISNCGVEEIVAVEGGGEVVAIRTLVFPRVTQLKFRNLPRLKWFYKGVHVSKWPMLKEMTIQECHKVEIFASEVVSFEKAVKDQRQSEISIKQPLFLVDELSFPSLKTLEVIWQNQVTATSFLNIPNVNNLLANLLFEKLERYKICIGIQRYRPSYFMAEDAFLRVLKLKLNMRFRWRLGVGIKMLLKRTECLYLDEENSTESVLYELHREDFQQLKYFHIQNNGKIKHILESGTSVVAFPILQTFVLNNMFSLEEICQDKLPLSSFKNLKVLKVEYCKKLKFIFSSSIARGLSLLRELNITRCDNLGAIFVKEEEDGIEDQGDMMLFGRLQTLVLRDLPKLVGFLSTKDSFMPDCRETNSEDNHDLQLTLLRHDQVSLPSLQTLRMEGLPKIKHVWNCGQEPKTVIRCLEQLQVLVIEDCGVEEIVAVEGGGEVVAIRTLEFPRVTTLNFSNLKRLKWFYKGVHVSEWPMLKEMTIQGCHKVEIFASEVVSFEKAVEDQRQSEMSNIKQPLFLVDEHSFPSLETLEFWNMDSLEIIFGKLEGQNGKEPQVLISPALGTEESGATTQFASTGKLPLIYFKNVKVLKVENCQKLRFVSSSSIAKVLSLLEKLKIKRCNNMGAIVVAEDKDGIEDGDVILFHQLQTLVLEDLPELVSFFSTKSSFMTDCGQIITEGNHNLHMPLLPHQVSFPSLQTLRMKDLPKIKHVWSDDQEPRTDFRLQNLQEICAKRCESLKSLFPTSVVRCLEQLQVIEIEDCGVEEIVAVEKGGGEVVAIRTLEFPRVTTLNFSNLKRLKWFYKEVHVSEWPMLKERKIERCKKVEIFASEVVSFEKTVQDQRQSELSIKQPLFSVDEVSFPSLQTLRMEGLPKIKYVWSCGQEPKTVIRCLEQLQVLDIQDCGVEEIVAVERGGEAVAIRTLVFPQVTKLYFRGLWRLKWFCKGVYVSKWPMLKEMTIQKCCKVEIFASEVVSFGKRDEDQRQSEMSIKQPLFSIDEHSFLSLEILKISKMDSLEIIFGKLEGQNGKNVVPSSVSLHNLTELKISDCHRLINLLTSSTAKTLVQLETITVIDCKRITEIVAMEDIGEANVAITFNKLRCLELRGLPNLTHFCSGPYSFGFPSLDEVIVRCCPEMKTFSHGVLSTPKLTAVYDDNRWSSKRNLHWKDDLNTTTRCLWEESNQYDTRLLFRERVENSEEDEDHSENSEEG